MSEIFIPPRTRAELSNPAPAGSRHEQAKRLSLSLIGQGLTPAAVFEQLRAMYDADVTDRELQGVIQWAAAKNPQPCGYGAPMPRQRIATPPTPRAETTQEQAIANAENWLGGFRCDGCDLWHRSPWQPLEDWRLDSLMFLAGLYDAADFVNIVTDYTTTRKKDGEEKTNPSGAGRTMLRDDWMREIRDNGTPKSEAGAWVRMNPCQPEGSGKGGAICDEDVTAHRFALLESDKLPETLALSVYAALPLPVVSIHASGGRGPHAWVRLDAAGADDYAQKVFRILSRLERIGIDQGNKNPSRLSRLPGALRQLGASGGGEQRLYYFNPDADGQPIFAKGGRA
jgi:hypothetical protein